MPSNHPPCRCGHTGDMPHPCHNRGYTCRKPATLRIYSLVPVSLAGMQLKLAANQTYACDDCWTEYQQYLNAP
jgi:hypothetical protein